MAHKTPHRKVTIELPLEDWQRLDHLSANSRRSKNAILLEWLASIMNRLRTRGGLRAAAGE